MNVTAVYVRLSKVDRDRRTGTIRQEATLDAQEAACRAYAESKGWANLRVYREEGRSAYREVDRPAFAQLEADITAGRVHAVLAWKVDRYYRNAARFLLFWELCKEHGTSLVVTSQGLDTSDPHGRSKLLGTLQAGLAEEESAIKSDRMTAHRQRMREQGRPRSGGSRQYGYEPDNLTPRPKEQRLIRKSADLLLTGSTMRAVWRLWNEQGIRSTRDRPVDTTTIRKVLLSGRFLSEPVAERVSAILRDPARLTNRQGANRKAHLLIDRAVCGRCGHHLVAGRTTRGVKIYACPGKEKGGCNGIKVWQVPLDEHVGMELYRTGFLPFTFPDTGAAGTDEEEALRQALTDDEARKANLAHGLANDAPNPAAVRLVNTALAEIEGRMVDTRRRLGEIARERAGHDAWSELIRSAPRGFDPADLSNPADFDRWKLLVEAAVSEVRVHAHPGGKGFKASRVEIVPAVGAVADADILAAWRAVFEA